MEILDYNSCTIGELVADKFQRAQIFKKFGIDYCCGGKKTLKEVLENRDELIQNIVRELEQMDQLVCNEPDFNTMDLTSLCNYIVAEHHEYIRNSVPFLIELSQKVARVHGHHNPDLMQIYKLFYELSAELLSHMEKEERILFPFIKRAEETKAEGTWSDRIMQPVRVMEMEHDAAGILLKGIRLASQDFELPDYACTSFRVLFAKLEEFENDLHRHIHLENNILFPRALQMGQ